MNGLEYVLIGAVLVVFAASIIMVVRQRRAELTAERQAAHSLQRMARTLEELQRELSTRDESERPADGSEPFHLQIVEDEPSAAESELERAVLDHEMLQVRLMLADTTARRWSADWTRVAEQHMLTTQRESGSIVHFWESLTRDASDGPSYSDVMGPLLEEYLIHAAKVGVVDREQADVLKEWADTTQAVVKTPRGAKRQTTVDAADKVFILSPEREAVG